MKRDRQKVAESVTRCTAFLLNYHPGTVKDLPVISPLARHLLDSHPDRQFTEDQLIQAFETDPFLSAKLFGVANSIFFNLDHHTVYTVREALARVGLDYATNLLCEAPYFSIECDVEAIHAYWSHCVEVAHTARALAIRASHVTLDAETVFLVALIHDIGYLLEMHYDPTLSEAVVDQLRDAEPDTESHTRRGESLAVHWSLPDCARHAIRWHHVPAVCPSRDGQLIAMLIWLAEIAVTIRHRAGTAEGADCAQALATLGLDHGQFQDVVATPMSPLPP